MELTAPPDDLGTEFGTLFDSKTCDLMEKLIRHFDKEVDQMMHRRNRIHHELLENPEKLPKFLDSKERKDPNWKINPLPKRAEKMRIIVGDLSPARTERFEGYMATEADAIQVKTKDLFGF